MATFRQLKSGNWQARVSDQGKEFSIGTFRTKKEAKLAAAKAEERIYYGHSTIDRNMLFDEVVEKWLKYKKLNVKNPTFEALERNARLHILPFFKGKKIVRINRDDVKIWLEEYAKAKDKDGSEKHSYNSRKNYYVTLKSIFHYAIDELEVLEKNPTNRLKLPVIDSVEALKNDTKYYSLAEKNKILDYMRNYKHRNYSEYQLYYTLIYFLFDTGLRISEALALKWSDIDGNKLNVERQTSRDKHNNLTITSLKNTSSYRTIKLDDNLLKELKKFKIKQNELVLKEKSFIKNQDNIIFQNHIGNYLITSTVRDMMKRYCKMIGVDYKGTHCFRHTHAVLLLESGASIKFVSERLGHKTIQTTSDTYLDITDKIEDDELNKYVTYNQTSKLNRHEIGTDEIEA